MPTDESGNGPNGRQLEIRHRGQRAVVVETGAGLRLYQWDGRELVAGYAEAEGPRGRGLVMIPWPGRLRDGAYRFDGADLSLPITDKVGHSAIHGLVRDLPWEVVDHAADSVTLTLVLGPIPGYPFRLGCEVRYSLDDGGLRCETRLENLGDVALPVGSGNHPYLRAGEDPIDGWTLRLPASRILEVDDLIVPTGVETDVTGTDLDFRDGAQIGARALDLCYGGLMPDPDGMVRATVSSPTGDGVTIWMGPEVGYAVLYTGEAIGRSGLAVEPLTCPPNAFQSGEGLKRLEPSERWGYSWGITRLP